jgi:hypothetical protein
MKEVIWTASFLRRDVYARFESYITHYLDVGTAIKYILEVRKVLEDIKEYIALLNKSYEDFDEVRTAEFQLMTTEQKDSVPEYLIRFI